MAKHITGQISKAKEKTPTQRGPKVPTIKRKQIIEKGTAEPIRPIQWGKQFQGVRGGVLSPVPLNIPTLPFRISIPPINTTVRSPFPPRVIPQSINPYGPTQRINQGRIQPIPYPFRQPIIPQPPIRMQPTPIRVQPYPFRRPMGQPPVRVQPYPPVTAQPYPPITPKKPVSIGRIPSARGGIRRVPKDMIVKVHKGETILPAKTKK
jgi:hypothetical protein